MSLKCIDFPNVIKSIIVNDCFVICVGSSLLSKTVDVTLEKLGHNNLPHNPHGSALGNPRSISWINHETSLNTSVKTTILILSISFTTGSVRPTLQVTGKTQEAH